MPAGRAAKSCAKYVWLFCPAPLGIVLWFDKLEFN